VEVHRFGHWSPGWFEIILVRPGTAAAEVAVEIEERLEDYPLLDEEDFSRREWEDYLESWECWGAREFADHLRDEFDLGMTLADWMRCDCDRDALREFFESGVRSGEYYVGESSGVSIRFRNFDCSREELAAFIRRQRAAVVV
jgi:hypothetical protein